METGIEYINLLAVEQFNWGNLIALGLALVAVYFLLKFLYRVIRKASFLKKAKEPLMGFVYYLLLVYEPLAIIILLSVFVMINPLFHGLILLLILLTSFPQIRNYINGRLILFDQTLIPGKQLMTSDIKGIISGAGRRGVYLQTHEGNHFVNYSNLVTHGYSVDMGEEVGGFYTVGIASSDPEDSPLDRSRFMDLLLTAPYLDLSFKPEFLLPQDIPGYLKVKILVKEEMHLYELMALISEWGFTTKIIENY